MKTALCLALILALMPAASARRRKEDKQPKPTPLDTYVEQAHRRAAAAAQEDPGSLWAGGSMLADLGADVRARRVDDVVTILVNESASAVSTGTTKTSRASAANSSVTLSTQSVIPKIS